MQYSFRLAELLGHVPDPRKRPGTIKAIVEYTGLDRHQVAALLKNEVKYIPLKALSRLCDFLIEHGHATADQLPGALFSVEPENFWELLARRRRLEMCVGVRKDVSAENPDVSFVVASDSVLLGEILNGGHHTWRYSETKKVGWEYVNDDVRLTPAPRTSETVARLESGSGGRTRGHPQGLNGLQRVLRIQRGQSTYWYWKYQKQPGC